MFNRIYINKPARQQLQGWVADQPFTHALTLNADRSLSISRIEAIFGLFCLQIDRFAHGRRPGRVPSGERFHSIAFPEHLETNAHLHVAADLTILPGPAARTEGEIETIIADAWQRSTRGAGSVNVAPFDRGWASYMTKDYVFADQPFFIASQFHPR